MIEMIRWTGLAPWEFEFLFPGSLTSTFLTAAATFAGETFAGGIPRLSPRMAPTNPREKSTPGVNFRATTSGPGVNFQSPQRRVSTSPARSVYPQNSPRIGYPQNSPRNGKGSNSLLGGNGSNVHWEEEAPPAPRLLSERSFPFLLNCRSGSASLGLADYC